MEINGKKVLTLPQQVLQNQKDIQELKDNATKIQLYQHNLYFKLEEAGDYFYAKITILSRKKEAFTLDYLKANPLGRIDPINERVASQFYFFYNMDVESDDLMLHELSGSFDFYNEYSENVESDYTVVAVNDIVNNI